MIGTPQITVELRPYYTRLPIVAGASIEHGPRTGRGLTGRADEGKNMIESGASTALLERAREEFLTRGDTSTVTELVRAPILASWRRSALHGLSPTRARPIHVDSIEQDGQLMRAARPVLEARTTMLADLSAAVTMTDNRGCILNRWVEDPAFARRLDARGVVPGNSLAESDIGTCSSGIALETGESVLVRGAEHFAEGATRMSTAGAPIHHPIGRQIVGTINLTCPVKDSSPLMLAWICEIAGHIENAIFESVTGREHSLLRTYLCSGRDSRHPVLCMDDTTIIGNAVAARMMSDVDLSAMLETASRVVESGQARRFELATTGGDTSIVVSGEPIEVGRRVIGAQLRLTTGRTVVSQRDLGSSAPARERTEAADVLPGLAGRSIAWVRLCGELNRLRSQEPLLLMGEQGTGKTAIVKTLAPDAVVLDVQEVRACGEDWVTRLRKELDGRPAAIALDGLHLLDARDLAVTFTVAAQSASRGVTILATYGYDAVEELNPQLDLSFPQWPGSVVRIPPLRERLGDIPLLLHTLTASRTASKVTPSWASDAVHTLTRVHWIGNVSSLESVVSAVLRRVMGPQIRAADLPPAIRSMAARRQLSGLDLIEAHAISAALVAAEGNKALAAARLNIARSTLYRKIRALGIDLSSTAF
ncbi:sigma-54-dependent Fis family transcriptional regulator [Nocardia rhamnosiphila]|uniref:Helix-turn-helix domain-containing protein n=1 Tax=Nocardia rhamnosiphila TaxID=426716 RepID=A0ABV2WRE5_9NOCA